jgi:hypothetical protein
MKETTYERYRRVLREITSCKALYNEWLTVGRPPIATFARTHGFKRSTMLRHLQRAEGGMPHGNRRLWWSRRDYKRGYPTEQEIWDEQNRQEHRT